MNSFRLRWNYTDYSKSSDHDVVSIATVCNDEQAAQINLEAEESWTATPDLQSAAITSPPSDANVIRSAGYAKMTEWCVHSMDAGKFVATLCRCLTRIDPDMVLNWGIEALQWSIGYKVGTFFFCIQVYLLSAGGSIS